MILGDVLLFLSSLLCVYIGVCTGVGDLREADWLSELVVSVKIVPEDFLQASRFLTESNC